MQARSMRSSSTCCGMPSRGCPGVRVLHHMPRLPVMPHFHQCQSTLLKATAVPAAMPGCWRVYTGRMPLIGLEAAADALKGTPARNLLLLHTYLLLEGPDQAGVWSFDFLPLNPTSPATALLLLTAGKSPGEVRVRRLEAVQQVVANDRVRLLGQCCCDALAVAQAFNKSYDKRLHLLNNNCMHYTNGLSRALLDKP